MKIIPLGSLVHDNITGFEGFAVFRLEHMHGCIRYGVQPVVDKDGQLPESKVLDGPDIKVIAPPKDDLPPAIKTNNTFKLGVKAKDLVTGFQGVIVVRIKHMYAGDRYGIQPPINEKKEIPEIKTFDEGDLEQIDPPLARKETKPKGKKPNYGPHDHSNAIAR
jgi:hypothetical protein